MVALSLRRRARWHGRCRLRRHFFGWRRWRLRAVASRSCCRSTSKRKCDLSWLWRTSDGNYMVQCTSTLPICQRATMTPRKITYSQSQCPGSFWLRCRAVNCGNSTSTYVNAKIFANGNIVMPPSAHCYGGVSGTGTGRRIDRFVSGHDVLATRLLIVIVMCRLMCTSNRAIANLAAPGHLTIDHVASLLAFAQISAPALQLLAQPFQSDDVDPDAAGRSAWLRRRISTRPDPDACRAV